MKNSTKTKLLTLQRLLKNNIQSHPMEESGASQKFGGFA